MSTHKRWKGLIVQDVPGKGPGVFTDRSFIQGEVVCDYHGRQVSREEGKEIYASTTNAPTAPVLGKPVEHYKTCTRIPACPFWRRPVKRHRVRQHVKRIHPLLFARGRT